MKDARAIAHVDVRSHVDVGPHVDVRPHAGIRPYAAWTDAVHDYLALAKPRLNLLVVATSAAGYYLGAPGRPDVLGMVQTAVGTALVAGGSAVLNQVYERDTDRLMRRTRMRPLPDGRVLVSDARNYGVALAVAGLATLVAFTNLTAAVLALATLLVYIFVYTPLKRRSSVATLVGAVPGALPPLIGWTAAHGGVSAGGIALFAIVFLWQMPHFMAIAWLYRDDYGNAGFPMLPVIEPDGRSTGRQALVYALLLLPASVAPTLIGLSGAAYAVTALTLGLALVWLARQFSSARDDRTARRLFFASIAYLPLLWAAMIADKL